ncbi:amidase family protein [Microbacterium amylolyticum]|uniref:Asp-tRNA(Asn)/Glu-tRNA(Gln) amidotransferase A subunit family amidase n=1 Tax=Microbacterium amylolyticum TaxID=936337 RepID=A0ABS4ZGP6_9MICO|nr:amidase family protein [Microbacterium amylolyticum]MBP2436453.1 Asp-tRNA(Asn)/Glu-tRNA(Gln) amidotransferase A subunit family amidase [Microbacterium amylolyticum]
MILSSAPEKTSMTPSRQRRTIALTAGAALLSGAFLTTPALADSETAGSAPAFLAPFFTEFDLTGNGSVSSEELQIVSDALGSTPEAGDELAVVDTDGDGVISISDLAEVASRMVYDDGDFDIIEASALSMQAAMNAGVTTSVELTQAYLDRIEAYDRSVIDDNGGRALNSIITTSEVALEAAEEADRIRAEEGMTSALLGVPVALKDNYNTADMPTTAGCGCWEDNHTTSDAAMVSGLRDAGAVILAKASLDEFAFGFSSEFSVGVDAGDTLLVASPYVTTRTAGGSSGGTGAAIAANLAGIGFGTDTGGSIRVPSSYNQLVGIRPTIGLSSRDGIVPLALSQDTGGPMARTVMDAALALDATTGIDPADQVTNAQAGLVPDSYTQSLDANALEGARIGYFASMLPQNATNQRVWQETVQTLEAQGATVVELAEPAGFGAVLAEPSGSTAEFRHDLDAYIAAHLSPDVAARSLNDIVETGHFVTSRQRTYEQRAAITAEQYEAWAGENGSHTLQLAAGKTLLHEVLNTHELDAIAYPSGTPYGTHAWNMRLSPNTGMPAVTVPMGVATAEDGTIDGAGVNLELLGRDFDEGTLLGLAYALEQAQPARTAPELYGPLG